MLDMTNPPNPGPYNPQQPQPSYGQQPSAPGQSLGGQPAPGAPQPAASRFSIGAIVAIVGAIITFIAYPLTWYTATSPVGDKATIGGFGTIKVNGEKVPDDVLKVDFNRWHWLPLAIGIVILIIAVVRLIGKYNDKWTSVSRYLIVLSIAGIVFSFLGSPKDADGVDFSASTGVYIASLGMLLTGVGLALISFLRR